jgi:hypothetical protein
MMRSYAKVERFVWIDPNFRNLSREARDLWMYLLTNPHTHGMPGLVYIPIPTIIHDLRYQDYFGNDCYTRTTEALNELVACGWVKYDNAACVAMIPRAVAHNPPENPNVIKSWRKQLREMPRGNLFGAWVANTIETFTAMEGGIAEHSWRLACFRKMISAMEQEDLAAAKAKELTPERIAGHLAWVYDNSDISLDELYEEGYLERPEAKARVYPPLSTRKSKPEPVYVNPVRLAPCPIDDLPQNDLPPVVTDEVELELPPQDVADDVEQVDNLQLLTQAFESGADVVSPEPEPAKGEGKRKRYPKVKPDIRERVSEEVKTLVDYFQHRLRKDKADCKLPEGSALDAWYYYMDLILGRDKRHRSEVSLLITWVTQDDFEKANVRCPRKLRERYDQLVVKMLAAKAKWEREQERLADGSSQNGNGRGYRQRNEEPAYPENFGEIPLRPREGDTDEERAAIAHRREVNMQIQREHERSIRQGAEERAERERIAKEEEQKFYAMALERREVYLKHEAEQKAQEAAAREADMRELSSQGMVLEPKTDEQQGRLDMALRRREMRRLRARLVQGGFLDASIPAIENDNTKTWNELEDGMLLLYRARAKEQKATQEAMGIPMENPYATLRQSPAMH